MRYGVIPGNLFERAFIAAGLIPVGLTEGYAPAFGRALLVAADLGIFDAIGRDGASAAQVATACGADVRATEKLLNLLASMRYLHRRDGRYTLARHVRRWLLADAPNSVRDMLRMKQLEWRWIEQLGEFVRTGQPIDVHATMSPGDWELYQRGMRAQANVLAPFLARQVPVPEGRHTHAGRGWVARLLLGCPLPAPSWPGVGGPGPPRSGGTRAADARIRGDG